MPSDTPKLTRKRQRNRVIEIRFPLTLHFLRDITITLYTILEVKTVDFSDGNIQTGQGLLYLLTRFLYQERSRETERVRSSACLKK